jgi:cytochrome c oxidase subunit 2
MSRQARELLGGIDRYERTWMTVSHVLLFTFLAAIAFTAFTSGFSVPSTGHRVDPATVTDEPPFAEPGLREVGPREYEAYLVSTQFVFEPREITVPAGSTVTFHVTSADVQHGFKIQDTNVNVQVVPGHVAMLTARFTEAGVYPYICHEYCGLGHAGMYGQLTVTGDGGN